MPRTTIRSDGEPGERLWPEWFTEDQVTEARSNAHKWVALYQQRPSAETGDYFKAEWLKPYTTAPDRQTLRIYGGSDYAVTSDGGDYTVHVVVGLDPEGRMYLLDLWRRQAASDEWVESFCDLVKQWKPMGWAAETGQIRSGVGPFLTARQRERQAYVVLETFPTRGDKERACADHPRPNGARRTVRPDQRALVSRLPRRAAGVPGRQAR